MVAEDYYLLKNTKANGWAKQAEVFSVATGSWAYILQIWDRDMRFLGEGLGNDSRELCDADTDLEPRSRDGRHLGRQMGADSGGY